VSSPLRRLSGFAGLGLWWGLYFASVFGLLFALIGAIRPQDIDGDPPLRAVGIGLLVGFVSGAVFGLILAVAEGRKTLLQLHLTRIALWGIAASATWPLLTGVDNRMVYIFCPLGALWAAVSVALARRATADKGNRGPIRRLLAEPLEAALGANV
jgi:hypothetical protein